jgi:hypothetical protein
MSWRAIGEGMNLGSIGLARCCKLKCAIKTVSLGWKPRALHHWLSFVHLIATYSDASLCQLLRSRVAGGALEVQRL